MANKKHFKEYVLRIVVDEDDEELIHLSERYDDDESEDKFRLEIKGEIVDAPEELQEILRDLDISDILGVAWSKPNPLRGFGVLWDIIKSIKFNTQYLIQ